MPEPKIEIIENICTPYSDNPNGIGIIFHPDPVGEYWINEINMELGEVKFCYHNLSYRDYLEPIEYTRHIVALQDKNVIYFQSKALTLPYDLIDDQRGIFYSCDQTQIQVPAVCYFDCRKETGVDIIDGRNIFLVYENITKYIRGYVNRELTPKTAYGDVGVVWRSNEFPYKNMTIYIDSKEHQTVSVHNIKYKIPASQIYNQGIKGVESYIESVKFKNQFYAEYDKYIIKILTINGSKKILNEPFLIPTFKYSKKILSENSALNHYIIDIDFLHNEKLFPEDQKRILCIDYDGYSDEKSIKIFNPETLRHAEIDEVHHDVVDLSQIKLSPERVAKSSKVTLYAFNGQSPFPGVGELVVK